MHLVALMLAAVLAAKATPGDGPQYREGESTFYQPEIITMERVARNRGLELTWESGWATYPDCSKIGSHILVSVLDPRTEQWSDWEWKKICDCSQPRDHARHVSIGLVELSHTDAQKYGYYYQGRTRSRHYPPVP